MEIHQSAVILLLLLAASFTTYGQLDRHPRFNNQHVYPNMNVNDCDRVIEQRIINPNGSPCKHLNTFIKANENEIDEVCGDGGTKLQSHNLFRSNQHFDLIACNLIISESNSKCKYRGQEKHGHHVILACDGNHPVHYERDEPHT